MKRSTFLYLICLFSLVSCKEDNDLFVSNETVVSSSILGSVGGLITDVEGLAVPNTSVFLEIKNSTIETQTDVNGVFYFKNIEIAEERTYLYTESATHFHGSRTFIPKRGDIEFINIRLLPKNELIAFEAVEGGTFDLNGGGKFSIHEAALEDLEGNNHEGIVKAVAIVLDTNDPAIGAIMPGDLLAENGKILASYGMMVVEMRDSENAMLNIADGMAATINIPVSADQVASAPSSIPLWFFDESNGTWLEEGTAQLVDGHYEAEITKFGYWNCSISYSSINVETQFSLAQNETPFMNTAAKVTVVGSDAVCAYVNTDSKGRLETSVPANQVLLLELFSQCGEVIYEVEIGPYDDNIALGKITVEPMNNNLVQLNGRLENCNNNAVAEGYVSINIASAEMVFFISEDGDFTNSFDACSATEFLLTGVDISNAKQSQTETFTLTETIDAGTISVCN